MKPYAKVNVSSSIPNAPVNQMGFFVTGDGYFHSDPIGNRLGMWMAFKGQGRTYKWQGIEFINEFSVDKYFAFEIEE